MSTIFALATPWGKSGVAVIRISGKSAFKTFEYFKVNRTIKPRYATLAKLYDSNNELIDEGLIIYFPEPQSFTGENLVELHLHGSISVVKTILKELAIFFIQATPGEFSFRAFLNGKMDLTRAEAVADLINSETEIQAKQALRQMSGKTEQLYKNWRQLLIDIHSNIEAYIDFPEEVTQSALANIECQLEGLKSSLLKHLDDKNKGEIIRKGLHVVIFGEPNVGKSTLFNCLAKRDVAIVSEYAGTTRDSLEVHLDIAGYPFVVTDTAGIRMSNDPIEVEGIKRTNFKIEKADFKIAMFSYEDKETLNSKVLSCIDENTICILSKADDSIEKITKINNIDFLVLSVHKNKGIDTLMNILHKKAEESFSFDDCPLITSDRHRNHLQKTVEILKLINTTQPIEFIAEDLRLAIREIGKVTGVITHDDIMDNIFSKFCLGK